MKLMTGQIIRRVTHQHGVALITVMLVVALATTAAVAMASRQQIDIRRTENTLFAGQSWMYLMGIESWSKQFLSQDRKDNDIDHNGENWATRLPPLPVEGGQLQGYLEDLQGRFNLNSLTQAGDAGKVARERFVRLLKIIGFNQEFSSIVKDWVDTDMEASFPDGAEDVYYLGEKPFYRAANQPMVSVSEVMLLKGISLEEYEKLLPYITVLPEAATVNVNTASLEVIASLADDLSVQELEALIEKREENPYETLDDFLAEKVFAGKEIPKQGLSVHSDYFVLNAQADIGHVTRNMTSLLRRDEKGLVYTLQRSEVDL